MRAVVSYWRKYVHEVLVNRLGGLSLPRKSVVRLTDRPDMTLDVYRGRKTTMQHSHQMKKRAAAMHGPHSVIDIGHCTIVHCDAGEVCRWLTNETNIGRPCNQVLDAIRRVSKSKTYFILKKKQVVKSLYPYTHATQP